MSAKAHKTASDSYFEHAALAGKYRHRFTEISRQASDLNAWLTKVKQAEDRAQNHNIFRNAKATAKIDPELTESWSLEHKRAGKMVKAALESLAAGTPLGEADLHHLDAQLALLVKETDRLGKHYQAVLPR